MSHNIKVAIKVRPLIKREKDDNLRIQWVVQGNSIVSTDTEIKKRGDGGFHFDHIFDMNTSNLEVFDTVVRPIVDATVNGFNGTVFAYGQTSSGKTYTMMGNAQEPGILPLAVDHMFDAIANTAGREFLLRVSYLEIYNEKVNDLLDKSRMDLKLKEDSSGQVFLLCKEEITNSLENILSIMKKGDKNRRIGETNMNERSSRSHTIFRITIESREVGADSDGAIQVSQLNLVDLAGSERARQTGTMGERFNEGRHINMSLSALSLVIMQLSESQDGQKYVNFRNHKLTRLLKNSLGGNAMTTIICAVTPAAVEETQCTLSFASRAKSVRNKPQINEVMSDGALLKRYAKQLAKLQLELSKAKNENRSAKVEEMESKLQEKDRINQLLEERIELLKTRIVSGNYPVSYSKSFKCQSKRRQTWGGPGVFNQPVESVVSPTADLPLIKEPSFEKSRRKSVLHSVDIMNETLQTAFTDFELQLLETERRCLSDSEEKPFVTKRKKHHVTFKDDVSTIAFKDSLIPEKNTTPKKCDISTQTINYSLSTSEHVLPKFVTTLMNDCEDFEHATLEKQLSCHENYCSQCEDKLRNKIIAIPKVKEQLNSINFAEKNMECIIVKLCTRLKEYEEQCKLENKANQKMTEKLEELQTQIQNFTLERNRFEYTICELRAQLELNNMSQESIREPIEEIGSISLEREILEMTEQTLELKERKDCEISDLEDSQKTITNVQTENENQKDQSEMQLSSFRFNESDVSFSSFMETEKRRFEETLHLKTQELGEVNDMIQSLKVVVEDLQNVICVLTTENMEMATKLTIEQENAKQTEFNLQRTIDELYTRIHEVTNEKIILEGDLTILRNQLECMQSRASETFNEEQLYQMYRSKIDKLTTENIELSAFIIEKNRELENIKENKSLLYDHECFYKEKVDVLTENNKYLSLENDELSTDLISKIEENDSLKEQCDILKNKLEQLLITKDDSQRHDFEPLRSENNILKTEIIELKAKVKILSDENTKFFDNNIKTMENLNCTYNERSFNILHLSTIDDGITNESLQDILKVKGREVLIDQIITLQGKIKHLIQLNNKLSHLKMTPCDRCAHLKEMNNSHRALKIEAKTLNKKLEDLQRKFNQKCLDTEILRSKINISNVQSNSLNESLADEMDVSFVEEKIQTLYDDLQTLKADHDNLLSLYRDKCEEHEKLLYDLITSEGNKNGYIIKQVSNHIDQLRNSINDLKKYNTSANFTVILDQLKQENADLLDEIRRLKIEREELQNSGAERTRIELTKKNKDIEQFSVQEKEFQSQRLMLETELEDLKVKEQNKNSLIDQLQEQISCLKHDFDLVVKEKNRLATSQTEYRNTVSHLEHLLMECNNEKEILKEKIKVLETDFSNLQLEFNEQCEVENRRKEAILIIQKTETEAQAELKDKDETETQAEFKDKDAKQVTDLLRLIESCKTTSIELNSTVEGLEASEKQLKNIIEANLTGIKKKNQNIERLTAELENLTEVYNKINHELEQKTLHIEEITAVSSDYKTKYETIILEHEMLKERFMNQETTVERYKKEIEALKKEEAALNTSIVTLREELNELDEKCQERREINMTQEKKLRDSEIKARENVKEANNLNKQQQDNLEGANNITEIEEVENQVLLLPEKDRITLELEDTKRVLNEKDAELKDFKTRIQQLTEANKELDNELEDYATLIRQQIDEIANLQYKLHSRLTENERINELEKKLTDRYEENEKLQGQVERLKTRLDMAQLEDCRPKLEAVIQILQKENLELKTKLNDGKKLPDSLTEENIELEKKLSLKLHSSEVELTNELEEKLKFLKSENEKLKIEIGKFQMKLKSAINEKASLKEGSVRQNLKTPVLDNEVGVDEIPCEEKYQQLKKKMRELELQLVSKNGKIAMLQIQIQCENFPYQKKCKELEEVLVAFRKKNSELNAEVRNLQRTVNDTNSLECEVCRKWRVNRKDQVCQTLSDDTSRLLGTNNGVVEDYRIQKLEREKMLMRDLCRSRTRRIIELENEIKEIQSSRV